MNHPALEIDYDPSDELKLRYELLCQQQPNLRARDAASLLNVAEGELLAARAGDSTFHLINRPEAILTALETIGELLMVTRNETTIVEKKGFYHNLNFNNHNGLQTAHCASDGLDLRLLVNNWHYSFLVIDEKHIGRNKSLQFFDATGQAIHKVYLTQNSNQQAFEKLIPQFISSFQPTYLDISKEKISAQVMPEQDIQWHKMRKSWQEMQSSHDFFQLLIGCKVSRQQAYDNVGPDLAYEIVPNALHQLFDAARKQNCALSIAVGNKGCMQFHSGHIHNSHEFGSWLNIRDFDANLYINTHKLTQAWVVRKPLSGGPVTSIEFFDEHDRLALQITSARKDGAPEPTQWRELLAQLEPRSLDASALNVYDAADS